MIESLEQVFFARFRRLPACSALREPAKERDPVNELGFRCGIWSPGCGSLSTVVLFWGRVLVVVFDGRIVSHWGHHVVQWRSCVRHGGRRVIRLRSEHGVARIHGFLCREMDIVAIDGL